MGRPTWIKPHRISIRPVELDDGPAIQRWASDPRIAETTTLPRPYPANGGEQWARACVEARRAGTRFPFAVLLDGEFDWVDRHQCRRHDSTDGLHGLLDCRPLLGAGIATTAGRLAAAWSFEELGLRELRSSCLARNLPSGRLLEKIGFSEIGGVLNKEGQWMRRFTLARFG